MTTYIPQQPTASDGPRRRYSLEELIQRRNSAGARWANLFSHGLIEEADEAAEIRARAEQAIGHCWPEVWQDKFNDWVTHDAGRLHSPDNPSQACSVCARVGSRVR